MKLIHILGIVLLLCMVSGCTYISMKPDLRVMINDPTRSYSEEEGDNTTFPPGNNTYSVNIKMELPTGEITDSHKFSANPLVQANSGGAVGQVTNTQDTKQ